MSFVEETSNGDYYCTPWNFVFKLGSVSKSNTYYHDNFHSL